MESITNNLKLEIARIMALIEQYKELPESKENLSTIALLNRLCDKSFYILENGHHENLIYQTTLLKRIII